jgi:hypothetical protein
MSSPILIRAPPRLDVAPRSGHGGNARLAALYFQAAELARRVGEEAATAAERGHGSRRQYNELVRAWHSAVKTAKTLPCECVSRELVRAFVGWRN